MRLISDRLNTNSLPHLPSNMPAPEVPNINNLKPACLKEPRSGDLFHLKNYSHFYVYL